MIAAMEQTDDMLGAQIDTISFSADDHTAMEIDDLAIYEMQKNGDEISFVPVEE